MIKEKEKTRFRYYLLSKIESIRKDIQMEEIKELLTEEHIAQIRKGISKAIKNIDFDKIINGFIESEFEYASDRCEVVNEIDSMIIQVIREHLVKSGLLKAED